MSQTGFFQQKRGSPASLAIVVVLHAAILSALILIKGPAFIGPDFTPTRVDLIPVPEDPPPVPETPPRPDIRPQPRSEIDRSALIPDRPTDGAAVEPMPLPLPGWSDGGIGTGTVADPPADPPPPVRVEAQVDPRYAGDLQPPYPTTEERAQRDGNVRIRVTIGADGRVKAAQRIAATSQAFWQAAERQALSRWRFRPATLDGRPVESSKVMTLHFRIQDR